MFENCRHIGLFEVYDHNQLSNEQLLDIMMGPGFANSKHLKNRRLCRNILMASQKLSMANAVYPTIDRLAITNQTGLPADTETSYSGTIYTTNASEEFTRSGNVNPYTVGWNILTDSANGTWGSFVLITQSGAMINRALAGITKFSGTAKLVMFTGSVTS